MEIQVDTRLLAGLASGEDIRRFKLEMSGATDVIKQLRHALQVSYDSLESERLKLDFSDGSWAYKQAYINGRQAEIKNTLTLLTIRKGETP